MAQATTIDGFLQRVRVGTENALNVQPIADALALFGFDAARVQAGVTLLTEAETLQASQVQEYSEQFVATTALQTAWKAADKTYMTHRALAQLALKSEPDRQKALLLHERKKLNLDSWLGQAGVFYTNLLGDSDLVTAMGQYNVTEQALTDAQAAVAEVAALDATQEKEKSEAQRATKLRDAAIDELAEWYVAFREVARIALQDDPQYLEALMLGPAP